MLEPVWIIGITGHRAIDEMRIGASLREALEKVKASLPTHARLEFLASIADGTDQLVLREVRRAGHRTHVVLPMHWDELKKDLDEASAERARAELDAAKSTRMAPGRQVRPECYADANTELVLASDAIIAVWDGQPARGVGGTAEVVTLARAASLPVVWIHSDSGAVEVERIDRLGGALNSELLARADELLASPGKDLTLGKGVRSGLWRTLVVGLAASVLGALASSIGSSSSSQLLPEFAWLTVMTLQLVCAVWLFLERRVISRRVAVQTWLEHRFAVEVLASTRTSAGLCDPLRPPLATLEPQWRRFAVTISTAEHAALKPEETWQQRRDRYVAERLLGGRGQAPYFQAAGGKARGEAERYARRSRIAASVLLGATIFSIAWKGTKLMMDLVDPKVLQTGPLASAMLRFLPAALPAIASAILSVEFLFDRKRRATTYPLLAGRLHTIASLLGVQSSEEASRRLVTEAERIVMTELQEWRASEERASGKSISSDAAKA
ncbi:MAG: hypothetical protein JNM17_16095 [Archangium sp.]|nr:hypothetical protein [Archangium sp.]